MELRFETIDLEKHAGVCVAFRRDSYEVSFGTSEGFEGEYLGYLDRMRRKIEALPQGNCHVWCGGEIIGQTEMRWVYGPQKGPDAVVRPGDGPGRARFGYVNLFYLVPEFRGRGLGAALHGRAVEVFGGQGAARMWLSVSPENASARRFYRKMGWVSLGPRPGREQMLLMGFELG